MKRIIQCVRVMEIHIIWDEECGCKSEKNIKSFVNLRSKEHLQKNNLNNIYYIICINI